MIGLPFLYALAAIVFGAYAAWNVVEERFGNAAFWGLLALSFAAGDLLGDLGNGILALALVALAGAGVLRPPRARTESLPPERQPAWKLFGPAALIPLATVVGTLTIADSGLVDPKQVTLVSLGAGVCLAMAAAMMWLRPPALTPVREGTHIANSVGWALVLPQMLAALGAVFALAGVGEAVGGVVRPLIPEGSRFVAVAAYCVGMALLTAALGNAFAAFPIMTAAVGLPILILGLGAEAAVVGAVGMLAGFCGTLCTPMAANFNIVPAALLELTDRYGVIRAQAGTAIVLLAANVVIMYVAAFR